MDKKQIENYIQFEDKSSPELNEKKEEGEKNRNIIFEFGAWWKWSK
jgi:hypothetical protein